VNIENTDPSISRYGEATPTPYINDGRPVAVRGWRSENGGGLNLDIEKPVFLVFAVFTTTTTTTTAGSFMAMKS
jgi:hypothetical protein